MALMEMRSLADPVASLSAAHRNLGTMLRSITPPSGRLTVAEAEAIISNPR
jgi:hypothetical protein